ncbi:MAG TPA: GNAT family N-acetyltransferase [Solirubrobacteraceae bacterium]|nr:GNAT family N-acetyltransferase [Solirubrobacteraceae bacterium]
MAAHAGLLEALFERNAVPEITTAFDPFPLTTERARQIAIEPRRDAYYVAVDSEQLVAMSMLRGFDERYETPSFGIFVDRASHGRGVGRSFTAWTIEEARRMGAPSVRLSVYGENTRALAIYRSLGFVEQQREVVTRAGGSSEKLILRLDLGS